MTVAKGGPKLKPPETPVVYKDDQERAEALRAGVMAQLAEAEVQHTQGLYLANATIGQFASQLSTRLGYPVEDGTQLEGSYAFTLTWSWDNASSVYPFSPLFRDS